MAINGLWGLLRNLNCKMIWSAFGVFLALIATNLKTAVLGLTLEDSEKMWIPWRSSRVIDLGADHTINEFPWFSFLWNDLHGHLSALPLEIGILSLCWGSIVSLGAVGYGRLVCQALLIAIAYGSLVVANAWDLPCYAAAIAISLLAALSIRDLSKPAAWAETQKMATQLVLLWVSLAAVFKILFRGFFANFVPPTSGYNIVPWEMKSPLGLFLLIFGGIFGVLMLPFVETVLQPVFSAVWRRGSNENRGNKTAVWGMFILTLVAQCLGSLLLISKIGGIESAKTPVLLFNLLVLAIVWLLVSWWRTEENVDCENGRVSLKADRFVALLLCLGVGLLLGCEFVAVKDFYGGEMLRLNTVFKFHFQAWVLLAIVAAYLTNGFLNRSIAAIRVDVPGKPAFVVALMAQCTLLLAVFGWTAMGSWSILAAKTSGFENKPTLDGLAYAFPERRGATHRAMSEDDARALLWLLDLQRFEFDPDRVILEHSGKPYSNDGRVSAFSGIPTLMAVGNHEGIWNRQKEEAIQEIGRRERAVKTIYTSNDFSESKRLMEDYGVTHVFFGTIELNQYGQKARQRFDRYMNVLKTFGSTVIYSGFKDIPIQKEVVPEVPPQPLRDAVSIQNPERPLQEPRGTAVGPENQLYVCNSKMGTVDVFSMEGEFVRSIGTPGQTPNSGELNPEYSGPGSVEVDPEGRVYVADTWNHRIAVYDPQGEFDTEWRSNFWGPRDVVLFGDRILVADTGHKRLVALDREGNTLQSLGREGSADGEFKEPVGLAVHQGEVYVADTGNTRIQVFGPDLQFKRGFPVAGWEDLVGTEPYLAFDARGRLWVTDSVNSRLQQYSPDGRLLAVFGPQVEGGTPLKNPKGIAFGNGILLLSDFGNQRLLKWSP